MAKHHLIPLIPAGIILLLFLALLSPERASSNSIDSLLPAPGFADALIIDGKITTYTERDLYKHINGEAELYYPYGFKALATALYVEAKGANGGITADIYEMGSLLDAFGIYSRYRDPEADVVNVGAEGFVNESQLLFYKDRYFVRLSASGDATLGRSIFLASAKAIADRIPGTSSQPAILDILKIPAVVPRTEAYISQSVLGYAFFKKGLTADARIDRKTVRVFVLPSESPASAKQTLDEYKMYLEKAGARFASVEGKDRPSLTANDPLYKGVMIRQVGSYLMGAAKLEDPSKAVPLLDLLERRIGPP